MYGLLNITSHETLLSALFLTRRNLNNLQLNKNNNHHSNNLQLNKNNNRSRSSKRRRPSMRKKKMRIPYQKSKRVIQDRDRRAHS
jgi:hypothetical protein